jgi:hypothetical protein
MGLEDKESEFWLLEFWLFCGDGAVGRLEEKESEFRLCCVDGVVGKVVGSGALGGTVLLGLLGDICGDGDWSVVVTKRMSLSIGVGQVEWYCQGVLGEED